MTKVVENQMLHTVFLGFPKQSTQQSAPAINTGVNKTRTSKVGAISKAQKA